MSDETLTADDPVARLDALLEWLGTHPDDRVREAVGELVAALRWLHATALERLVELLAEERERFVRAIEDPFVAHLLELYDLVILDESRRGEAPPAGGDVSVVPAEKLRELAARLERGPREVADEAPAGSHGADGFVRLGDRAPRLDLGALAELPDEPLHGVLVEGYPVLLVRQGGGERHAFRNACPGSILPLHLGALVDGAIRCPWHGCRFDAATGEPLEGAAGALVALPLTVEDGLVTVEPR